MRSELIVAVKFTLRFRLLILFAVGLILADSFSHLLSGASAQDTEDVQVQDPVILKLKL